MNRLVYLLLGPENGEKQTFLKQIISKLPKSLEIHRFYPFDLTGEQLFGALENRSLFSEHRLVILSGCEQITEPVTTVLEQYLKNPSSSATLVLISDQTYLKQKKITSLIPKENTKVFWELFENQKASWVKGYFARKRIPITAGGVETILSLVSNDTREMKVFCNQLAFYRIMEKIDRPLDTPEIENYLSHTRAEDADTLFPEICACNLEKSLSILKIILESGDSSTGFVLYAKLMWKLRRLESAISLAATATNEKEIFDHVTMLGKPAAVRAYREKEAFRNGMRNYSLSDIRNILIKFNDMDTILKQAQDMEPVIWENLIINTILFKGRSPSKMAEELNPAVTE